MDTTATRPATGRSVLAGVLDRGGRGGVRRRDRLPPAAALAPLLRQVDARGRAGLRRACSTPSAGSPSSPACSCSPTSGGAERRAPSRDWAGGVLPRRRRVPALRRPGPAQGAGPAPDPLRASTCCPTTWPGTSPARWASWSGSCCSWAPRARSRCAPGTGPDRRGARGPRRAGRARVSGCAALLVLAVAALYRRRRPAPACPGGPLAPSALGRGRRRRRGDGRRAAPAPGRPGRVRGARRRPPPARDGRAAAPRAGRTRHARPARTARDRAPPTARRAGQPPRPRAGVGARRRRPRARRDVRLLPHRPVRPGPRAPGADGPRAPAHGARGPPAQRGPRRPRPAPAPPRGSSAPWCSCWSWPPGTTCWPS